MFIKKQSELADPLEFLNMNTGYIQVKYQLLKQWPVVSADLASTEPLLKVILELEVKRLESQHKSGLEDNMENIQKQVESQELLGEAQYKYINNDNAEAGA